MVEGSAIPFIALQDGKFEVTKEADAFLKTVGAHSLLRRHADHPPHGCGFSRGTRCPLTFPFSHHLLTRETWLRPFGPILRQSRERGSHTRPNPLPACEHKRMLSAIREYYSCGDVLTESFLRADQGAGCRYRSRGLVPHGQVVPDEPNPAPAARRFPGVWIRPIAARWIIAA